MMPELTVSPSYAASFNTSNVFILTYRWAELSKLLKERRDAVLSVREVQTYHFECIETTQWIRDKARLIAATEDLGNDLAGITSLQRRLKGMESDLAAIDAKVKSCH